MRATVSEHITRDSYPWFLAALDEDPQRATAGFHEFAWKLLRSSPPPRFRGLQEADREDVIAELVAHWLADDCRLLRRYKDTGRPFAGYLATAANNRAIDFWRRMKKGSVPIGGPDGEEPVLDVADPGAGEDVRALDRLELERVDKCVGGLSERCQVLLHGAADGHKPRELVILLGWPVDWNKKAHDALRECRNSLRRCLDRG